MAAPSEWIARHVKGLREAKAAFNALPAIVRENMLAATETTVREIARGAQARLQSSPSIRTRALYNHVAWKVTKSNGRGRVGIADGVVTVAEGSQKSLKVRDIIAHRGGRLISVRPVRYAHLVEHGRRGVPAEPFMLPAAEAQKQPYLERCRAAGRGIEKDVATIGQGRV
jgi:hypothetical protein